MESQQITDFPEPRKVFLGFLIQRMMDIEERIYLHVPPSTTSVNAMLGLIDSLSEESKKKLSSEYAELTKMCNTGSFGAPDLNRIYGTISSYLHDTYLLEVHTAAPKFKQNKPLSVPEQ